LFQVIPSSTPISPNKIAATAVRKPFVASTNKLNIAEVPTKEFIPAEKPKEKNPMLQPRQGIKELPVDDK